MSSLDKRPRVCVVGAGVIGLSTAQSLRSRGYDVVLLSARPPSETTSQGAGGFWEPFKCEPQEAVNKWAKVTLEQRYLKELHASWNGGNVGKPNSGLIECLSVVQLHNNTSPPPSWAQSSPYLNFRTVTVDELAALGQKKSGSMVRTGDGMIVPHYCWDGSKGRASLPVGWQRYSHAWVWHSVVVDSPRYLEAMLSALQNDPHVTISIGPQSEFSSLDAAVAAARDVYGCAALVNCTGLGASLLCADEGMLAGRGGIAMYPRPGRATLAQRSPPSNSRGGAEDDEGEGEGSPVCWNCVVMCEDAPLGSFTEPAYVIPRGDIMVVGGSYYEMGPSAAVAASPAVAAASVTDPAELIRLASNRVALAHGGPAAAAAAPPSPASKALMTPVRTWVGLRPVRQTGIRVEVDPEAATAREGGGTFAVVHNYGHGGSGWTVMHGTAEAAADLVDASLAGHDARPIRAKL